MLTFISLCVTLAAFCWVNTKHHTDGNPARGYIYWLLRYVLGLAVAIQLVGLCVVLN